jgi:hypothetical protein
LNFKHLLHFLLTNLDFIVCLIIVKRQRERKTKIAQKLNYLFGKASGNPQTIIRSKEMLRLLESIGIFDTPENRDYILNYLENVFYDETNIIETQADGRMIKDSLLMGKQGGLRMQTVWSEDILITFFLKKGGN